MEQNFVFQCTPLEPDALIPQVSQALEVRTEFVSRAVCPKLWAVTDRLNRTKKTPAALRDRRRRKGQILGLVNWGMALLLLPTAFLTPDSLLLSIAGGLCLGVGVVELWRYLPKTLGILSLLAGIFFLSAVLGDPDEMAILVYLVAQYLIVALASLLVRRRRDPFERAARKALVGRDRADFAAGTADMQVIFSEETMTVNISVNTSGMASAHFPYTDFKQILETQDLLLVIFDKRFLILQKKDLTAGTISDLRAFLRERVEHWSEIIDNGHLGS